MKERYRLFLTYFPIVATIGYLVLDDCLNPKHDPREAQALARQREVVASIYESSMQQARGLVHEIFRQHYRK